MSLKDKVCYKISWCTYWWKPLMETARKWCQHKNIKKHWYPLQIYRNNKQSLLKQLYFSFIHCHLNYANIACANTYKIKLEGLHHQQKHAAHIINFKDRFTYAQPLHHDMKALNIFQINLFQIIFLMFKCKKKIPPLIFYNFFMSKPGNKYNILPRGKLTKLFYRKNVHGQW